MGYHSCDAKTHHCAIPHGQGKNEYRVKSTVSSKLGFVRLNSSNQHGYSYKCQNCHSIQYMPVRVTANRTKRTSRRVRYTVAKYWQVSSPISSIFVVPLESIDKDMKSMPPYSTATKTPLETSHWTQ